MKRVILLVAIAVLAASRAQAQCPEGQVEAGGLGTSGCTYTFGCYTPKEKAKADEWFAKCWCGEGGFGSFSLGPKGLHGFARSPEWKDGQCVTRYFKYEGRRKTEISHEEYNCTSGWQTLSPDGKWVKPINQPQCAKYRAKRRFSRKR